MYHILYYAQDVKICSINKANGGTTCYSQEVVLYLATKQQAFTFKIWVSSIDMEILSAYGPKVISVPMFIACKARVKYN